MNRILLLIATNFAVMLVLSLTANLLGVSQWMSANGQSFGSLLVFCSLFGFGGAFISLLLSKRMAKLSTGAWVITGKEGPVEQWLVDSVAVLAQRAGIQMPEVAIYEGAANAFATGPSKNSALIAVSSGLLETMNREQVEAVLAHEVSHAANNDLVTLTLVQGVVNTFVMFLARVIGAVIDRGVLRGEGRGIGYMASVFVLEILFGFMASLVVAYFSRQREFRADAGAAQLMGSPAAMISALAALGQLQDDTRALPNNLKAFGIAGQPRWLSLFASHPSIKARVAALEVGLYAGKA